MNAKLDAAFVDARFDSRLVTVSPFPRHQTGQFAEPPGHGSAKAGEPANDRTARHNGINHWPSQPLADGRIAHAAGRTRRIGIVRSTSVSSLPIRANSTRRRDGASLASLQTAVQPVLAA